MTEQQNLRKLFIKGGKSITEISNETGHDRKKGLFKNDS